MKERQNLSIYQKSTHVLCPVLCLWEEGRRVGWQLKPSLCYIDSLGISMCLLVNLAFAMIFHPFISFAAFDNVSPNARAHFVCVQAYAFVFVPELCKRTLLYEIGIQGDCEPLKSEMPFQ